MKGDFMRKITLIICLLFFTTIFSQTHRFIYQVDLKLNDKIEKMNMVLDIDNKFVKFYDYKFLEMDNGEEFADEIIQRGVIKIKH